MKTARLPNPPVLVVTDRQQCRAALNTEDAIYRVADAVFAAGGRWISLREKDLDPEVQKTLALELKRRAACYGFAARVSVHGLPEVALKAHTDGVHLPGNADAGEARQLLGPEVLIGQSVHTVAEAHTANPEVLDYLIAGPIFETPSKPGYGPALGEAGLAAIVQAARLPVIAIGGIEPAMVPLCLQAGAAGVAVMGGVMRAATPETVVRAFVDQFA